MVVSLQTDFTLPLYQHPSDGDPYYNSNSYYEKYRGHYSDYPSYPRSQSGASCEFEVYNTSGNDVVLEIQNFNKGYVNHGETCTFSYPVSPGYSGGNGVKSTLIMRAVSLSGNGASNWQRFNAFGGNHVNLIVRRGGNGLLLQYR